MSIIYGVRISRLKRLVDLSGCIESSILISSWLWCAIACLFLARLLLYRQLLLIWWLVSNLIKKMEFAQYINILFFNFFNSLLQNLELLADILGIG